MGKTKGRKNAGVAPGPERADWHNADIKAALEKAGWSLRKLSQHHGFGDSTFRKALVHQYPRAEKAIADAIGITPQEIWPSRYDAGGNPVHQKRGKKTRSQAHILAGQSNKCSAGTESLAQEEPGDEHKQ